MNRRIISAVVAVALATVGTFVLVAYVRSAENRALAGEQTANVLVVTEAIEKGTAAADVAGRVREAAVPAKVVGEGAISDLAELEGKVTSVDLVPGEQLLASRFVTPEAFTAQNRIDIPEGSQLVTVELEPKRAVGGQLRPGDSVGFFASFTDGEDDSGERGEATTHLTLHKLLVASVQTNEAVAEVNEDQTIAAAPTQTLFVTFAVDAAVAERVVFAAEHGTIWLSQEPDAADEQGTRIQTMETIYE